MKKTKQEKEVEKLLFEIYEKGLQQKVCDLTEYSEKIKQALTIPAVSGM